MRTLVLSDLHLEFGAPYVVPTDACFDAVVLAGDIHSPGHRAVEWAKCQKAFGNCPVVLVPGNHEFYGTVMAHERQRMNAAANGSNVHLLDSSVKIIQGIRFVGCTLWTDFELPVQQVDGSMATNRVRALSEAAVYLNDFRRIEVLTLSGSHGNDRRRHRPLSPRDAAAMHWRARRWLQRVLAEPFEGPTVVVTHHAPSIGSVASRYAADWLTPAFASHLPEPLFDVPSLWIHGHTHSSFDYMRKACRVASNPRGYPSFIGHFENPDFCPGLVVEVPES